MPRPKQNICRKFFEFDFEKKINKCIVKEKEHVCGKVLNNDHGTNLACHIRTHHKQIWEQISKDRGNKSIKKPNQPTTNNDLNRNLLNMLKVNITMSKVVLLKSCVELCTVNGRPFSIVDDSGFRKIIEPILKGLGNFAISRKILKEEVLQKYKEITLKISTEMKGKLISLKVDGLTHLNRGFLGVNAQFIENDRIVLRTLAVAELFERHTGQYLKDTIINILHTYNVVTEQIYTCTTDNGRNMLKCISLINECEDVNDAEDDDIEFNQTLENFTFDTKCIGIRCAAHTLQLAVNAVLKEDEMVKVIEKARSVVKKLRTPNINLLLKNQKLTKPTIDCVTRWSSTFDMLSSLIDDKMKDFCENLAQANTDFFICNKMWQNIKDAVVALRPANIATKILQKEQLTFGDAFDAWFTCKIELQKIKNYFSYNLFEEIKKKEEILFENEAFLGALFMDPRWNIVLKGIFVERAIDHILRVSAKMDTISRSFCIAIDDDNVSFSSSSSSDGVEAILKSMERENSSLTPNNEKIRELLNAFRNEKRVQRHVNVLNWWKEQSKAKPELYAIAKIILAVPATQVSVERLFSGVKYIMNPSRNRLDEDSLNAVIVIRSNTELF